jgi:hypothetical protein
MHFDAILMEIYASIMKCINKSVAFVEGIFTVLQEVFYTLPENCEDNTFGKVII